MEKINSKKPKESARDRHLKWINYYGSKNFGIWVECTECKKWRRNLQYSESHEVPENWCCSMLSLESGEKGSCNDPEEENADQYLDYSPGSIVWAKLEGYPWWPAMVDGDPVTDEYALRENGILCYNVTFLDKKPTRAWIPKMFICPFLEPPKVKKGCLEKFRQSKYAKEISKAKTRAEAAMKMTIKERLQTYSFVHLYKGHWPTAPNFEECDIEENGSRNIEDTADILLKDPDELGPSDSTNVDDKRIEKDFSRKENNTAEEGKLISQNPEILSLQKKTCNKKLLSNEDFIPENEGVFPFMKKKDSKYSSSANKTLKNALVECAESIIDPVQEKGAKGMKRKVNRKFTPRKEKKFEKPSQSLTDGNIDLESTNSEHEGNENLNAVSVPEGRSVAESNENGLPEVPNYEKHGAEKQTDNEKEFKKNTNISTDRTTHSTHLSRKEEMVKHIDEAISTVSGFVDNEGLKIFDKSNSSGEKKVIKRSNELPKKSIKQKKSQNSFENIKQSNNKIENSAENITHLSQVPPETRVLPNASSFISKTNEQIITGATKLTKKSQKSMKPNDCKMNGFPKQPTSSFSVPVKDSAGRNNEVVVNENTTAKNVSKENKILKPMPQSPQKIVILL
ncbi:Zinc finger CW-type PWWP domain protein 1 [Araneus ventricosus]|uniref:Zinc finger CW-type PWWP domain protein 1 n=1 Tax=Araneus ventricosus TaxID=182803 RepID=A0A4Y2FYF4_ARAVE|nr:Zinc finger CW-type PWWP domain protein 1 [Araneus ventricosus]